MIAVTKRRHVPDKPRCENGARGLVVVGMTDILPAMNLLLTGFAVSFLFLLGEIFYKFIINHAIVAKK